MTQFLTPEDYNADELRLSLVRMVSSPKKQSRAFCPRGEGNGVDNSCGTAGGSAASYAIASDAITQSIPESDRAAVRLGLEQVFFDRGQLEDGVPFKTTTKVAEVAIKRPEDVLSRAKALGIKDPSSIPVIGCGTIPDAMVRISPFAADDGIRIKSTIPLGDGPTSSATVEVGISGIENPKVKYGFFDLTPKAKQQIDNGGVSLTRVSATLLSVMSTSLEAAEKNGFSEAVTDAAGNGIGRFASGPSDALQGYRLWPKFGFDADAGSMITQRFMLETNPATGKPFGEGLSYEARRRGNKGESLRVQEIIETKQGEEWWNKHGSGTVMTLDFSDKTSLGYRRYREMLAVGKKMAARLGKQGRSAFEFWLWAAGETGMPEFRNCEMALFRAFCPRGEGNGIDNSCGAKTMSAPDRGGGGGAAKPPSWMGVVDATGTTNHGDWFLEQNTSKSKSAGHEEVTSHVVRLVGSDDSVKAFAHADLSDDKKDLYMSYAEVAEPHRHQGIYTSLLSSLSEKFRVTSDEQHNVATPARKAYESLGARINRYGRYVLEKKQTRAFCATGVGGGVKNDCGPGHTAKSFPEGSQNLRDAVDSVAPAPEQVWDRSRGLAETPAPKAMDDIANEQTSHSGAALTPEAEASYGSLVDEIGRQYEALTDAGLKARAWRGDGEPYGDPPGSTKPNSDKMRQEIAKTGEFSFFMTDKGFGTGDATPNHPMLRETKFKTADGEPMIANDLFRVVHDMVAHVRGGYSFSTNGEYNGMLTHASTLPEAAWPALFAETFGQNAVYEKTKNYAPQNAYASKVGPAIIRSELKKRNKSSRAAKDDGDEPLGYQHIKSRPALLKSLVEARAFCATGQGNGIDNSCGAKTMSAPDKDGGGGGVSLPESNTYSSWKASGNTGINLDSSTLRSSPPFRGAASLDSLQVASPRIVAINLDDLADGGLSVEDAAAIGGIGVREGSARISGGTGRETKISFSTNYPAAKGEPDGWRVSTDIAIVREQSQSFLQEQSVVLYDVLDVIPPKGVIGTPDDSTAARIVSLFTQQVAESMASAERSGFNSARMRAIGSAESGQKGYRLWPQFGFDAELPAHITKQLLRESPDNLHPDFVARIERGARPTVQDLVATRQGKLWWDKHGEDINLTFDFTNRKSLGYAKYQEMISRIPALRRRNESRSTDCGRDDDGKFSSGNKCGGSVDMPKEDPRGRMRYGNGVQTDAARKLYQMGSSEKRLKSLVDVMGGDPKNTRVDINPPSLNISVADKDGNKLFHVDFENGRARLYPAKDLSPDEATKIKEAAGEAFGGRQADTTIKVFSKAADMTKWNSENATKIKKWEDKYAFSTLLPPHQRPKKWERSLDARYASLLAFAESRAFCATGEGNGVKNDCSSKDGGGGQDKQSGGSPGEKQEFFGTLLDAKATSTTIESDSGPITVIDRSDVTSKDYLDDIEAEGERLGLITNFDSAVSLSMQRYSPIYEDEGPYAAFVRAGCSVMSGQDCGMESNAEETIDYNGTEYGTISQDEADEMAGQRAEEILKENWDTTVDHELEFPGWSEQTDEWKDEARDGWMDSNRESAEDEAREGIDETREELRQAAIPKMRRALEKDLARTELECCLQLYRGMSLSDTEIKRILKDGAIGHEGANSWTTSRTTARGFGANEVLLVLRKPTVGHIYQTDHSGEKEITRPPSKMRIVGVVKTRATYYGASQGTVLYLEEDPDYKRRKDDE